MSLTAATRVSHLDIAKTLGRVAQMWFNPEHPLCQEAVSGLQVSTGFSSSMIQTALRNAFDELSEEKILAFCDSEPGFLQLGRESSAVLHVLAGNVFTSWLPGAVITLLLGGQCALKTSSREPVFASLWKRSIDIVNRALGQKIQIVEWDDDLLRRYQAVVAYGSDETLEQLRQKTLPRVRFIGYGHKISVAVIFSEELAEDRLEKLLELARRDIEPFQLQGCLSPQIIYVEGGNSQIFDLLKGEIEIMPQIKRFDNWNEVYSELQSLRPHLSTLGYAGPKKRIQAERSRMEALGFSRICRLGEMQKPPLTWRNGRISLVEMLTRR